VAPTGQYYSTHLINPGNNRWVFKPEIGLSQRWRNWLLYACAAAWLFTANTNYLTGSEFSKRQNTVNQAPIGAVDMHLSYNLKPRLWASIDGNYWHGGGTTVNGAVRTGTLQPDSRIGGTISVLFSRHQSVKFSYSDGELARIGGTFQTVSTAWQYSWIGSPK
jgi:Putative MetA-pathway of phenol degradation